MIMIFIIITIMKIMMMIMIIMITITKILNEHSCKGFVRTMYKQKLFIFK